mmetsp:Transcript_33189/g.94371  ORF Transcript_33189/g.94371 Transcript_33189/m.94371 type:complete len:98 (+) Transcript_33189:1985-2278(+)
MGEAKGGQMLLKAVSNQDLPLEDLMHRLSDFRKAHSLRVVCRNSIWGYFCAPKVSDWYWNLHKRIQYHFGIPVDHRYSRHRRSTMPDRNEFAMEGEV